MSLTTAVLPATRQLPASFRSLLLWAAVLAAFVILWRYGSGWAEWAFTYPANAMIPAQAVVGGFMSWLVNDASFGLFTFQQATRFLAALIEYPYDFVLSVLATGFLSGQGSTAVQLVPPVSWLALIGLMIYLRMRPQDE